MDNNIYQGVTWPSYGVPTSSGHQVSFGTYIEFNSYNYLMKHESDLQLIPIH